MLQSSIRRKRGATPRPAELVSVVIPVRDREDYLGEAIDSILAQDYNPLEVIVVDDGSTDGTPDVARSRPVTYLRQEPSGVAAALNAGIAAARGELIAFNGSDDVWLPAKLPTQTRYLAEHPEADMVAAPLELLLEPGAERPSWLALEKRRPGDVLPQQGTWLLRRRALERVGPFDTTLEGEDTDWLLRARDAGLHIGVIEEPVLRYRVHAGNLTGERLGEMRRDRARMLQASIRRKRARAAVSAVIVVRDGERYLGEAIESVLGQTAPPSEVLVLDDGSTDGTAEVARSFGPAVRVIERPPRGVAVARNEAIAAARGDVLAFLDADDRWDPRWIERALAALADDPELELVFGHVQEFEGEATLGEARAGAVMGGLVARRAVFERIGPLEENDGQGEFLEWLLRAREHGVRERMLPEVVLHRRRHEGNRSRSDETGRDYARILKSALDRRRESAR